MSESSDHTNLGERQGARPDGLGYFAHLSIYDYVRPAAVGKRVLDVGCGTGYGSEYLKKMGAAQVVGLERDADLIDHLRRTIDGVEFLRCDLDKDRFPVPAAAYDVVFCSNVLEHVAYVDPVMAEFARVIAPGGTLVVAVPPIIDAAGLAANASNIFHITNLPVASWRAKLERHFEEVTEISHQFSHPDFNPLAGIKKPGEYSLSSFVFKPRDPKLPWNSITAMFQCRMPRRTPLDASHEIAVPPEWNELRLAADARQKAFADASQVDLYWRKEVVDIRNWLADLIVRGVPAKEIVAQVQARLANYYVGV